VSLSPAEGNSCVTWARTSSSVRASAGAIAPRQSPLFALLVSRRSFTVSQAALPSVLRDPWLALPWHLSSLELASRSAVRSVLKARSVPSMLRRLYLPGTATAPLIRNRAKIPFWASLIAHLASYGIMYGAMDGQRHQNPGMVPRSRTR
jgi:hypothetical protein